MLKLVQHDGGLLDLFLPQTVFLDCFKLLLGLFIHVSEITRQEEKMQFDIFNSLPVTPPSPSSLFQKLQIICLFCLICLMFNCICRLEK